MLASAASSFGCCQRSVVAALLHTHRGDVLPIRGYKDCCVDSFGFCRREQICASYPSCHIVANQLADRWLLGRSSWRRICNCGVAVRSITFVHPEALQRSCEAVCSKRHWYYFSCFALACCRHNCPNDLSSSHWSVRLNTMPAPAAKMLLLLVALAAFLVSRAAGAQPAVACPLSEANYGPFTVADVKLIQQACDPYSIITMQQFCRACTCAINRGLITSLEATGSLIGNMTARKAFAELAADTSTLTQVPGLASCGSLETSVMLKSGAMTQETVSVSSTCWNLGPAFLADVYDSCDYTLAAATSGARGVPVSAWSSAFLTLLALAVLAVVQ